MIKKEIYPKTKRIPVKGFALVELLAVIVIIAILLTIFAPLILQSI